MQSSAALRLVLSFDPLPFRLLIRVRPWPQPNLNLSDVISLALALLEPQLQGFKLFDLHLPNRYPNHHLPKPLCISFRPESGNSDGDPHDGVGVGHITLSEGLPLPPMSSDVLAMPQSEVGIEWRGDPCKGRLSTLSRPPSLERRSLEASIYRASDKVMGYIK